MGNATSGAEESRSLPVLPSDVTFTILSFVPTSQRVKYRRVSKVWRNWIDLSIRNLDLSTLVALAQVFTLQMDLPIIHETAETISVAERLLLTAASRFTNLIKIKVGAEKKVVQETNIAHPIHIIEQQPFEKTEHPLAASISKKRALSEFDAVNRNVNEAINRHQVLDRELLWNDLSLKRARDDIDPLLIVHLAKNCPKLTDLHLYGLTRVTDGVLASIVDLRPNIRQLNIINTSVSIFGLEYALKNLPNLEKLSFGRTISSGYLLCPPHRNFPPAALMNLKDLDTWKNLRKIRISFSSTSGMTELLLPCSKLEKFHNVGIYMPLIERQTTFPNLTSLDIHVSTFTNVAELISKHPNLERISLRGNVSSSDLQAIIQSVKCLKALRLHIYYDDVIDEKLLRQVLDRHSETLESLELCEIRTITPYAINGSFPKLKTIVLKKCSKISGSDLFKFVPKPKEHYSEEEYEKYYNIEGTLNGLDFSTLRNEGDCYAPVEYLDQWTGFHLRTTIGSPFDPAYW